ncbi:tRNA synthetase, B5 domain protein, partial [mine drainage metagenome]
LESTGLKERTAGGRILGLLQVVFAARGWGWSPVAVHGLAEPRAAPAPGHLPARIGLSARRLAERTGYDLSPAEVEEWLGRARLDVHPAPGGWEIEIPPWRPDLLGEVDLTEEVLVARGLTADEGRILPSRTRGGRLAEIQFRRRLAPLLLGLGAVPLYNTVLVSAETVEMLGSPPAIRIEHPVSREYAYARPSLLLS